MGEQYLMKIIATSIFLILSSILILGSGVYAQSGALYVTVRETHLRLKPDFLSKSVSPIKYGDHLIIQEDNSPWYKVQNAKGASGYVHQSAVTTRQVVLNPEAAFSSNNVSSKTIVMAGKGFNEKVEKEYASRNGSLNYKAVDAMERRSIPYSEISAFASQGLLSTSQKSTNN